MTPLRQKMIDEMIVQRLSEKTQSSYLYTVKNLAKYYRRSPDQISSEEVKAFLLYLTKEKQLSSSTCRLHLNGIRFLFLNVLGSDEMHVDIKFPKKPQRIPELLSHDEVKAIIDAPSNFKHRTILMTCYGCGLRVSEIVALKVRHIDYERHALHIVQAKGAKDRRVMMNESLATQLRTYQERCRPKSWLFYSTTTERPLVIETVQKIFVRAKQSAQIEKSGGTHSLRHAYATHQIVAGMPIHSLQHQLGHTNINTTLRYVHWLPEFYEGGGKDLLAGMEV